MFDATELDPAKDKAGGPAIEERISARARARPIVHEAAEAYVALARQRGDSPVELALGYVRSRRYVGASIIGATSLAQLREDIAAAQTDLDAQTLADIAAIQARYATPAGHRRSADQSKRNDQSLT